MVNRDIDKYASVMKEIKLRLRVVDFFLSGAGQALFEPTTLETIGLQLRKILELVAFASLVANKAEYSVIYIDFAKHWNAGDLLKNLARVNANFYPKPIIETLAADASGLRKTDYRRKDYLDQSQFVSIYGRCGVLMHASNPFGHRIDYKYYKDNIPRWRHELINLLNCHELHLVGDSGYYIIHMQELGDDEVHYYRFDPLI